MASLQLGKNLIRRNARPRIIERFPDHPDEFRIQRLGGWRIFVLLVRACGHFSAAPSVERQSRPGGKAAQGTCGRDAKFVYSTPLTTPSRTKGASLKRVRTVADGFCGMCCRLFLRKDTKGQVKGAAPDPALVLRVFPRKSRAGWPGGNARFESGGAVSGSSLDPERSSA